MPVSFVLAGEETSLNPPVDSYAVTARDPDDLARTEHLIKHISTREIERHLRGIGPVGRSAPMGFRVHGCKYIAAVAPGCEFSGIAMIAQSAEKSICLLHGVCPITSRCHTRICTAMSAIRTEQIARASLPKGSESWQIGLGVKGACTRRPAYGKPLTPSAAR